MIYLNAFIGEAAKKKLINNIFDLFIVRERNPLNIIYRENEELIAKQISELPNDYDININNKDKKITFGLLTCYRFFKPEISRSSSDLFKSKDEKFVVGFDGVIENYDEIKTYLEKDNVIIKTDSYIELIVKLIDNCIEKFGMNINQFDIITEILGSIVGPFTIIILTNAENGELYVATRGKVMIIGEKNDDFLISNDLNTVLQFSDNLTYLNDFEIASIRNGNLSINSFERTFYRSKSHLKFILEFDYNKGIFDHFLLKEILEQDKSILRTIQDRINEKEGTSFLQEIHTGIDFNNIDNVIITGCGSSWCTCLIASYMIEEYTHIEVRPIYASDLRYRALTYNKKTLFIAISQSGETADTIAALDIAKSKGIKTMSIVNVVSSSLSRISDITLYTYSGTEVGVASTKAFTSQVILMALFTLSLGRFSTISLLEGREIIGNIFSLPSKIQKIYKQLPVIKEIASQIKYSTNIGILGFRYNYPIAKEGALKFTELSYIHATEIFASEMKHGPITLVDQLMPFIVILREDEGFEKVISNIQELKARKALVILITDISLDKRYFALADYVIEIPKVAEMLTPILNIIPLQLLAYYVAVERGCNVDQPRNLAKSVTVE